MPGWCSGENGEVCISEGVNLSLPCELSDTLWRHNDEEILYITPAGKILSSSNVDLEVAGNGTHLIINNIRAGVPGLERNVKQHILLIYIFRIILLLLQVMENLDAHSM